MAQPGWPPGPGRRSIGSMPTEALRAVLRSKIAVGTSSGPEWLNEPRVRIHKGGSTKMSQAYHDLCRDRYRQTQARCRTRGQPRTVAGREHTRKATHVCWRGCGSIASSASGSRRAAVTSSRSSPSCGASGSWSWCSSRPRSAPMPSFTCNGPRTTRSMRL